MFKTATAAAVGAGGSVTVTKPAGVVAGDRLIAFTNFRGLQPVPLTPPAGFTQLGGDHIGSAQLTCEVWVKTAGGAEPANYTFAITPPSEAQSGVVVMIRDDTPQPFASISGGVSDANGTGGTGGVVTAPSLAPTRGPGTFYAAWGIQGQGAAFMVGAATPTGGFTLAAGASSDPAGPPDSGGSSLAVGYKTDAGPASGATAISTGIGVNWAGFIQAILEPAGGSFPGEPGGGVW